MPPHDQAATIYGVDFSSTQIDVAVMVPGWKGVRFDRFPLERFGSKLDRCRGMRGVGRMLFALPGDAFVAIEEPWSKQGPSLVALNLTLGALTAAIPQRMPVAWISPQDWRGELGAANLNSKEAGHDAVRSEAARLELAVPKNPSEHQLDALGLCLTMRRLLAARTEERVSA